MKIFDHTIYAPNRTPKFENTSALSVPSVVDTYQYGYRVNIYSGSKSAWTLEKQTTFTYDGWNLIQEQTTSGSDVSLTNSAFTQFRTSNYVWGLDLSQTTQGAGGVGGLLAASIPNSEFVINNYYYTYDGNGNVSELISESGEVAAHYEYSPFGKVVHKSGPLADKNPFQFSTKYLDNETQLYYYGYRYYNPENGRWINRDSEWVWENGGENLYSFVVNYTTGFYDYLGEKDDSKKDKEKALKEAIKKCKKAQRKRRKSIRKLLKGRTKPDKLKCDDKCERIDVIVELSHTCADIVEDRGFDPYGHTGIGCNGDYNDHGPGGERKPGYPVVPADGVPWWDRQLDQDGDGNADLDDIINNIADVAEGHVFQISGCVCPEEAEKVRNFWKKYIKKRKNGKCNWCVQGDQCTTVVDDSVKHIPGWDLGIINWSPDAYFEDLMDNAKHTCGSHKGKKAAVGWIFKEPIVKK